MTVLGEAKYCLLAAMTSCKMFLVQVADIVLADLQHFMFV